MSYISEYLLFENLLQLKNYLQWIILCVLIYEITNYNFEVHVTNHSIYHYNIDEVPSNPFLVLNILVKSCLCI